MTDERGWIPPAKEAAKEEKRRQWNLIGQLLTLETESLFRNALSSQGIIENSEPWNVALDAYRGYWKELKEIEERERR